MGSNLTGITAAAAGTAVELGAFAGHRLFALPGDSPAREKWEDAAARAGLTPTLPQRADWDPVAQAQQSWMIAATGGDNVIEAACVARVYRSSIPFHRIFRVERLAIPPVPALTAVMRGVAACAERIPRVIRAHVELFDLSGSRRGDTAAAATGAGFAHWDSPRGYVRTAVMDLRADAETLLGGLHPTARRHVRSVSRHPVEVRVIGPDFPAPVLQRLLDETMSRTGGKLAHKPWADILGLSARRPDLSRVIGLFRTDTDDPSALLGFAWGCHHQDHAHYAAAASTRRTELRVPILYPLAWDLILWARLHGAVIFDFGGITMGALGSDDPLGGISDFKRRFTDHVVEVGSEWAYEPRTMSSRAARWVVAAGRGKPLAGGL
jgi:hypothetical protein